uniref:uncharacterized protein LOC122610450 n=1 Tax=Erigeron canadensis TaxID=72917 RepID=UPI001CB8E0D6|nr:uncharacterized protein LOC122610450 [Erigeron canadensis]
MVIIADVRHTKVEARKAEAWKKAMINFPPIAEEEAFVGPLIVSAVMGNHPVRRVYVDTGSACEIMYEHCFLKLRHALRKTKKNISCPLVGFTGERSWSLGEITLHVTVGTIPMIRTEMLTFIIVRSDSPYNVILGRTAMRKMGIIPSPMHGMVMFSTPYGIGCIKADSQEEYCCAHVEVTEDKPKGELPNKVEGPEEKLFINDKHPDQHVLIGRQLPTEFKRKLRSLLKKHKEVFAWTLADMTGVPRQITIDGEKFDTQHKLNTRPHVEPIKQKRRSLAPERSKVACEQVADLVKAGILREVKYQSCVANPVMVRKHDGGWRMCVDFTNINKACPKDCYPLPKID